MNLSEMTTFVRTHADTDSTDAPDSTLTVYARAAYADIRSRVHQFLDYESSDTFTSVANTASYALSGMTAGTLDLVSQVVGPTEVLQYVPWSTYLQMLEGPDISHTTTEADYWTVRGGSLYLYPTPSAATAYTVYGLRKETDWPSGSAEPDLPREFDEVICWYMLFRYYQAQEDLELAQLYLRDYETAVNRFVEMQMRSDVHRPRVLHGSPRRSLSYASWVRRNTEG